MTHPAPEIPARLCAEAELPSAARKVAELARQYDWKCRLSYARGTVLGSDRVVDSHLIRMSRAGHQLAAVWLDGGFDFAMERTGYRKLTARVLIDRVKDLGTTGQSELF